MEVCEIRRCERYGGVRGTTYLSHFTYLSWVHWHEWSHFMIVNSLHSTILKQLPVLRPLSLAPLTQADTLSLQHLFRGRYHRLLLHRRVLPPHRIHPCSRNVAEEDLELTCTVSVQWAYSECIVGV
jgi:hypothetical protein